jgi:hypothetical protein
MDRGLALIIGFTFYKIACVACGAFVCWLGYRLFVGGLWNSAGDVEGKFGEASIVFRSAAPGTFFTVLGMVLSIMAVWRGYDFSTGDGSQAAEIRKAVESAKTVEAAKPQLP